MSYCEEAMVHYTSAEDLVGAPFDNVSYDSAAQMGSLRMKRCNDCTDFTGTIAFFNFMFPGVRDILVLNCDSSPNCVYHKMLDDKWVLQSSQGNGEGYDVNRGAFVLKG